MPVLVPVDEYTQPVVAMQAQFVRFGGIKVVFLAGM
jgi:hypothetical protein